MVGGSSALANLGTRPFEKVESKVMRAYAQNGQYHTIMEGRES